MTDYITSLTAFAPQFIMMGTRKRGWYYSRHYIKISQEDFVLQLHPTINMSHSFGGQGTLLRLCSNQNSKSITQNVVWLSRFIPPGLDSLNL